MRGNYLTLLLLLFPARAWSQTAGVPHLVVDEKDGYFGAVAWSLPAQEKALTTPEDHLRVYTQSPGKAIADKLPAVMGRYEFHGRQLYFLPRFPFLAGRSYWVWYDGEVMELQVPLKQHLEAPAITAVYPSGEVWPSNQLKFYLHFDQPMRAGFSGEFIRLQDENGREIPAPFLDMGQELWDQEQQRLTVWFDPGRIKTHLIPNQKMGPPLQADHAYQLIIRKGWPAANGTVLPENYIKSFTTGPKDQEIPRPDQWEIRTPPAGTHSPLTIYFPEAMDMALLYSGFGLLTASGKLLEGSIQVKNREQSWEWVPKDPWKPGTYLLRVSTDVEDLAGNNLLRLFDSPFGEKEKDQEPLPYLEFKIIIH